MEGVNASDEEDKYFLHRGLGGMPLSAGDITLERVAFDFPLEGRHSLLRVLWRVRTSSSRAISARGQCAHFGGYTHIIQRV